MVDTNEAYKPSQRWILPVGLGSLVWARLKTVYLTTILGLKNNNSFPTLKSLPAAARLPVISQSKLLSTRHRDTHGHFWVIHSHSRNTHGVSRDTHGLSWDTLAILRSMASTPAPLGVGVPMVRPQHKPHHLGTPLSHTGTLGSREGDHPSL